MIKCYFSRPDPDPLDPDPLPLTLSLLAEGLFQVHRVLLLYGKDGP